MATWWDFDPLREDFLRERERQIARHQIKGQFRAAQRERAQDADKATRRWVFLPFRRRVIRYLLTEE